ncbi:putative General alpha-glucoside permease [Glarea lozoyensis 74030]|nr:putative General alpha-glucoside permease [Glarea lozoyensis 74030]
MASRIVGVGNIVGYIAGYLELPKYLGFLNTQFKALCVIASICLASTVAISVLTVKERDPRLQPKAAKDSKAGLIHFFRTVFVSVRRLPPQTRKVCEVQFFAWIGFFPQLFYSSSYIGDIYVQPYLIENPNMTPQELELLYEKATRVGTFALLVYACTSLTTNIFLPFFIAPSYDNKSSAASQYSHKSYTTRLSRFLDRLVIPWLTLRRAWLIAHLVFAGCMFSTLIVRSIGAATALIGVVGISWALTLWAPFAIISAEVSKRDALRRTRSVNSSANAPPEDQAGVILGIHNMSIAAPQIIATLASSAVFHFMQKPRGTPGDHSFAVVLAGGGLSTLVAAFLTSRIRDEVELPEEGVVEEARIDGESARMLVRRGSMSGLEY